LSRGCHRAIRAAFAKAFISLGILEFMLDHPRSLLNPPVKLNNGLYNLEIGEPGSATTVIPSPMAITSNVLAKLISTDRRFTIRHSLIFSF